VETDTTDISYLSNTDQIAKDLADISSQFDGVTVVAGATYDGPLVLSTIRAKTYSEQGGIIEVTTQLDN